MYICKHGLITHSPTLLSELHKYILNIQRGAQQEFAKEEFDIYSIYIMFEKESPSFFLIIIITCKYRLINK